MRHASVFAIAIAAVGAACAPIEAARVQDTPLRSESETVASGTPKAVATVQTDDSGGIVRVQTHSSCVEQSVTVVQRREITERHTSWGMAALLYGLGGTGVIIGGAVLADAHNVPQPGDPTTTNPVSRSGAYTIGGSILAVGGAILATAIGTSIRARDDVKDLGEFRIPESAIEKPGQCNVRMAAKHEIVIVLGSTRLSLGRTNGKGEVAFHWSDLEAGLNTDSPPETGPIEAVEFGTIGQLDLSRGRAFWARRNVAEAKTLAEHNEVDKAEALVERGQRILPDVDAADAKAAIVAAPESIARAHAAEEAKKAEVQAREAQEAATKAEVAEHLKRAKASIKRNDPDTAVAELDEAERIACRARSQTECTADDEVTTLRQAVEDTPKARRRAKEAEREAQRQAAVAAEEERRRQVEKPFEEGLPVHIGQAWNEGREALPGGELRRPEGLPIVQYSWSNLNRSSSLGMITAIMIESTGSVVQSIWVSVDSPKARNCRTTVSLIKRSISTAWQNWSADKPSYGYFGFRASLGDVRFWGQCAEVGSASRHDLLTIRMER